jgi:3-hydroxybutyryl-CoA dehydrogenase
MGAFRVEQFVEFGIIPVIRAMQIVVLSNESLQEELLSQGSTPDTELIFVTEVSGFLQHPKADAFIDLLFQKEEGRIQLLQRLLPQTVIINSVAHTLKESDPSFIRINGWNTFLKSSTIEAAASQEAKRKAEVVFQQLHKNLEWLPDVPGFITPRVVSMIINEAYLSLEEGVSSKEEMNTAMRLGTNYPYGPFEWAEKIGMEHIARLLQALSRQQVRYAPAPLLLSAISLTQ